MTITSLATSTVSWMVTHPSIDRAHGCLTSVIGPQMVAPCQRGSFNSYSMLLTGRDTFSAIICHVVCNYISNPVKYKWLQAYIPSQFKSGKDYIISSAMHNFSTWGTKVEIITMAQISGFDIYVYTRNSGWL